MDESRNEYSHLDWHKGDIPRDRDGQYLVYLSEPVLSNRIAICRVRKIASGNPKKAFGLMVTLNSNFEWDYPECKILAWVSTDELEPDLEMLK